jgi:hypothetical protein
VYYSTDLLRVLILGKVEEGAVIVLVNVIIKLIFRQAEQFKINKKRDIMNR